MEAQVVSAQEYGKEKSVSPQMLTDLHRHLIALLLHNPFGDDLHLLHSMRKQSPDLSMAELKLLKQECNLETREAVCSVLLRKLFSGCGGSLNSIQLKFVRQVCPELNNQ